MQDDGTVIDIDMDRVVADRDYRRRVIHRLRQERLMAEAQKRAERRDQLEGSGEDD